jgi:hypothetical protein
MPNVNNQMIAAINARNNQHSSNKNNMLDNTVEEVIVLNPEHAAALKRKLKISRDSCNAFEATIVVLAK